MADQEGSARAVSAARTIAALAVVGVAVGLAVLPALFVLGLIAGPLKAGMATVAAVAGGVKLAVTAWGLAGRWMQRTAPWTSAASIE